MGNDVHGRSEPPCAPICRISTLKGLEFTYKGGRGRAEIDIDFGQKKFDLQGRIDGMDAARLYGGFSGRADLEVRGRGEFLKDPLEITYRMGKLNSIRRLGVQRQGPGQDPDRFFRFHLEHERRSAEPDRRVPVLARDQPQGGALFRVVQFQADRPGPADPLEKQRRHRPPARADLLGQRRRHQRPRRGHLFRPDPLPAELLPFLGQFPGHGHLRQQDLFAAVAERGDGRRQSGGPRPAGHGPRRPAEHELQPPGQEPAPVSHGPHLLPGQPRPEPEIPAEKIAAVGDPGVPVGRLAAGDRRGFRFQHPRGTFHRRIQDPRDAAAGHRAQLRQHPDEQFPGAHPRQIQTAPDRKRRFPHSERDLRRQRGGDLFFRPLLQPVEGQAGFQQQIHHRSADHHRIRGLHPELSHPLRHPRQRLARQAGTGILAAAASPRISWP